MASATVTRVTATKNKNPIIISTFQLPSVNASTANSSFVDLTISGMSGTIQLLGISISCSSTDYDCSILNLSDSTSTTGLNTINEIINIDGINLAYEDSELGDLIVQNEDTVPVEKLYAYIKNDDGVNATGIIKLQLVYMAFENR